MNEVLASAIAAIFQERGGEFNRAFAAASHLVAEFGEERLAERVVAQVPNSVSWEIVADLLTILQWSTSDNGAAISQQAEEWLIEGDDLHKIRIALNLDTYPFADIHQMVAVLHQVSSKHPEVVTHCAHLIAQRQMEGCA